ncbi:MAG: type 2 isopentenyl-diphosphate Delta-isomerase [Thermoplasmata archaeon]
MDNIAKKYSQRKKEHVELVLNKDISSSYNYWNDIELVHNSLPEVDLDTISTQTKFLSKNFSYPFVITAMTGGYKKGKYINNTIAKISAELRIGVGIGSERGAIVSEDLKKSYSIIKDYDIPLKIANIGAPQLINQKKSKALSDDDIAMLIDLINADVIAIHLNALQESLQPEGDTNYLGIFERINDLSKKFPIIIKETGAGISEEVSAMLKDSPIKAIDVSGKGGTSFAKIELYRAIERKTYHAQMGKIYEEWGIPSPLAVLYGKKSSKPIIGSGGILTGLDAAKAIAVGSDIAGMARPVLMAMKEGYESNSKDEMLKEARQFMDNFINEFKVAMFLTGSSNINNLKKANYIIKGECQEWIRWKYMKQQLKF